MTRVKRFKKQLTRQLKPYKTNKRDLTNLNCIGKIIKVVRQAAGMILSNKAKIRSL